VTSRTNREREKVYRGQLRETASVLALAVLVSPALAQTPDGSVKVTYGTPLELTVSLPKFVAPGKVVLMAPGSMTHHSDMHARYVELTVEESGVDISNSTVTLHCTMPTESIAPRGYYMVFALTDGDVPSVAQWIQIVQ